MTAGATPVLSRRRVFAIGAVLALLVVMTMSSSTGGADTPAATTALEAAGSWGPYREVLTWQNDLADAQSPVDLQYTPHGTLLGRQDFIAGTADFVLSAVPFSPAENAKAPGGGGVIGAPVQVSSMAGLLQRPVPDGFLTIKLLCDPDDPNTPDPAACIVREPYTGAVRIPHANLASMLLRYTGGVVPPLSSWNHPGVLRANGVDNFTTPPLAGPAPVLRSDQDEFNYFLQKYAATAAPSVWAGLKAQDTRIPWEPISERLGRTASASRDGVEQQGQQLALGGGDPSTGTISGFTAGVMAVAPASAMGGVKQSFPNAKVEFVEVQNANGDWVAPSPESISKAIEAGGETPLYALTNKVPGAYPLAWVDYLYAPAKGLSREKAEAIASVIRYIATAGQKAAQPVGEGRLSVDLTQKALAAANQIIESNCAGKVIDNTDAGPYAPDLPELESIGTVKHCTTEPKEAPPATAPPATGSFSSTDFSSAGATVDSAATTPTADSTANRGDDDTERTVAVALTATKLPLPLPSSLTRLDRLATIFLGAALFLLLRKPVGRMLTKARAS
jgi:ABC-type phosphate transport system substrate-binding protein